MELLLGCGNSRERKLRPQGTASTWTNLVTLDIDPQCGADVVHNLETLPYPFSDGAVSEIHAYEVLEHQGRQGDWRFFFDQWAEFWRIVQPNGRFYGSCPHYASNWAWGDPSHARIIGVEHLSFLSQKHYAENVGKTDMTDFRWYYQSDWQLIFHEVRDGKTWFCLEALK